MKTQYTLILTVALAILIIVTPWAAPPQLGQTNAGQAFVDSNGMTLYTFDKDEPGTSRCNGPCLQQWPAALAEEEDTPTDIFTLVKRADGQRQWAYQGMPLYRWVLDLEAGQATGDGVGGVWHVAKPAQPQPQSAEEGAE